MILDAIFRAALGTGFTFALTSLGAATVFFLTKEPQPGFQRGLIGFAAGVMTAASVWSLLLPAIEQTRSLPRWLPAAAGLIAGVLFLASMDALLRRAQHFSAGRDRSNALLMTAITLHNIPEGMAVGLAFALAGETQDGLTAAAALALGIGIQNFPEGAAVSLPLRQEGKSRLMSFAGGVLSGAVEPMFGVLVVLAASGVQALMPWLLSFAAGAMVYVVVEELVPQAHSRAGTCGFMAGFLVMMVLDVALG